MNKNNITATADKTVYAVRATPSPKLLPSVATSHIPKTLGETADLSKSNPLEKP